mmetsp:Transcript_342/g.467  ORF Transcript_342/g.467 Transcript_342/m.467 type:complete len:122 (+) Transcript_342:2101-2466(+)
MIDCSDANGDRIDTKDHQEFLEMMGAYLYRPTDMDNWKLQIRAADCDLIYTELATLTERQKHAYLNNCVDVKAGEKPEIRIASPWTSFNITNQVLFENIKFTGEDLFASAKWVTPSQTYSF